MDFLGTLKDAINFTWKHKVLWIFGFILALFGGGVYNGFNFTGGNSDFSNEGITGDSEIDEKFTEFEDAFESFFSEPEGLITIAIAIIFFLVIALVGWYLISLSKAALVNSVRMDDKGEKPTLKNSWAFGKTKAFTYMLFDLIMLSINLLAASPFIVLGIIIGIAGAPSILFLVPFCIAFPFYFVYFVFINMVITGAQRLIVLEDLSAWNSIKAGYELAKRNVINYVAGALVAIIPGCLWGCISFIILGIFFFILAIFAIVILLTGNFVLFVLVGAFVLVIVALSSAAINSPFEVFAHTYWTKLVIKMKEEEGEGE